MYNFYSPPHRPGFSQTTEVRCKLPIFNTSTISSHATPSTSTKNEIPSQSSQKSSQVNANFNLGISFADDDDDDDFEEDPPGTPKYSSSLLKTPGNSNASVKLSCNSSRRIFDVCSTSASSPSVLQNSEVDNPDFQHDSKFDGIDVIPPSSDEDDSRQFATANEESGSTSRNACADVDIEESDDDVGPAPTSSKSRRGLVLMSDTEEEVSGDEQDEEYEEMEEDEDPEDKKLNSDEGK